MDDNGQLAALREEIAALRKEVADSRPATPEGGPISRRGLLMGLAGAGAASVATLAGTGRADADDGDNLVLGQENAAITSTTVQYTADDADAAAFVVRSSGDFALYATTRPGNDPSPRNGFGAAIVGLGNGTLDTPGDGISGITEHGFAVIGSNESAAYSAMYGYNNGAGIGVAAQSAGHGPQVCLVQEEGSSPGPSTGLAPTGSIRLDSNGDLWLCLVGQEDPSDPKTEWTRLLREDTAAGRTIPITPFRALDTRAAGGRPSGSPTVPGQQVGPLKGGVSLTLDLAGAGSVPATAAGVIGNLTVVSPSYSGYLIAQPSGSAVSTSTLNFPSSTSVIANAFTSALGPDGLTLRASGTAANTYHLIVDITAYIT